VGDPIVNDLRSASRGRLKIDDRNYGVGFRLGRTFLTPRIFLFVSCCSWGFLEEREGSLFWPERFGPTEIAALKNSLGPYMSSGRLQQSPQPKGGELFRREWWQLYDKNANNNHYPPTTFRVASLDGAFTADESNDPSAMTVWGVFRPEGVNTPRVLLMDGWRRFLQLQCRNRHRLDTSACRLVTQAGHPRPWLCRSLVGPWSRAETTM
jgi:hypothetical protein